MEIPVLIHRLPNGQGFEARTGEPFAATARALSEKEALTKVEIALREQVEAGAKLHTLHLDFAQPTMPTEFLPDDEFTRGWLESIEEYRRQKNSEPDPWELTPEGRAAMGSGTATAGREEPTEPFAPSDE